MKRKKTRLRNRKGLFLLDVCVGMAIILVTLTVFMQAAFQLADHRNERKSGQIAVDTLLNIGEMLDFETMSENPDDFERQLEPLREMVAETFPDGKLAIQTLPDVSGSDVVLFRISVSYNNGEGCPRREFHLVRAVEKP